MTVPVRKSGTHAYWSFVRRIRRYATHALRVGVLAAALTPPAAHAAVSNCKSAPGTAAIDQYCEEIPGADGDRGSTGGAGGGSGIPVGATSTPQARRALRTRVDTATLRRLRQDGPAGRQLLRSIALASGKAPAKRVTTAPSSGKAATTGV